MSKSEVFIHTLIELINQTEPSQLSVESVAQKMAMSRWGLQRSFQALTGLSVGDYLRQVRLSHAAKALIETQQRLLDIALDVGFESQEAFTRAFKAQFANTPREYRNAGNLHGITLQLVIPQKPIWSKVMKINIVTKPAMTIVGLQDYFTAEGSEKADNFEVIPALWGNLNRNAKELAISAHQWLGFMTSSDQPDKGELIYVAGFEKPENFVLPDGWVEVNVAAQNYAVVPHHGLLESLGNTLDTFYGGWLPESDYNQGEDCGIEMYDDRFDPNSEASYFETWVPVSKKK